MKRLLASLALVVLLLFNILLLQAIFQGRSSQEKTWLQQTVDVFKPAKEDPFKEMEELENPELGFYRDPYYLVDMDWEGNGPDRSELEMLQQREKVAMGMRKSDPVEAILQASSTPQKYAIFGLLPDEGEEWKDYYAKARKTAVEEAKKYISQCRSGKLKKACRIKHLMKGFGLDDQEVGTKEAEVETFIHQREILTAKFYLQKYKEGNQFAWDCLRYHKELLKEIGVSQEEHTKLDHEFLVTRAKKWLASCREDPRRIDAFERYIRDASLDEIGTSEQELADLRKKAEKVKEKS